jgi:hypothetical protein
MFMVTNVEEVPGTNEGVFREICPASPQMGPREFRQKSPFQMTTCAFPKSPLEVEQSRVVAG